MILGALSVPVSAQGQLLAPASPAASRIASSTGNVNRQGERIYHMPGQRDYDRVVMDPSKGKKWFCPEEDAVREGWRKARDHWFLQGNVPNCLYSAGRGQR